LTPSILMMNSPPPVIRIRRALREGNLQQAFIHLTERLARRPVSESSRREAANWMVRYEVFAAQRQEMTQPERMTERQQIENQLDALLQRIEAEETQRLPQIRRGQWAIVLIAAFVLLVLIGWAIVSQSH
jgi:hypothetical protein